jgi:hypothetical protein
MGLRILAKIRWEFALLNLAPDLAAQRPKLAAVRAVASARFPASYLETDHHVSDGVDVNAASSASFLCCSVWTCASNAETVSACK